MTTPPQLAARIETIHSNGGGFLSAPETLALAAQNLPDDQLIAQTQALQAAAQRQPSQMSSAAYDPTDTATQSSQDSLVQNAHVIVGGTPQFTDDHLTSIQGALQAQGYGTDLSSDGAWSPDWQAQYSQFQNDAISRQYSGEGQPGEETTKSAIGQFLDALTPSHAVDAALGFVKSLPSQVRDLGADTSGAIGGLFSFTNRELGGLLTGQDFSEAGQSQIFDQAHSDAYLAGARTSGLLTRIGTLGQDSGPTLQQYKAQFQDANGNEDAGKIAARVVQNVGTALLFMPLGKAASSLTAVKAAGADGVRSAALSAVTPSSELALRTPGVLVSKVAASDAGKGLLSKVAAATNPLAPYLSPVLKGVDAGTAKLLGAGADQAADLNRFYRLRTAIASPYRIPAIQAAGSAFQKTIGAGAVARGEAALETKLGTDPNDAFVSSVRGSYLDSYDVHNSLLEHLGLNTPGDVLNDLGYVLHGAIPTPGSAISKTGNAAALGKASDGALAAASTAFGGKASVLGEFQRAINKVSGENYSYQDLVEKFGGEPQFKVFMDQKINDAAASWQAERETAGEAVTAGDATGVDLATQRANDIKSDPARLSQAISDWENNGQAYSSFTRSLHNSADSVDLLAGNGAANYMKAVFALQDVTRDPELRAQLGTPELTQAAMNLRSAQREQQAMQDAIPLAGDTPVPTGKIHPTAQMGLDNNLNQARAKVGLVRQDALTVQKLGATVTSVTRSVNKLDAQIAKLDPQADAERIAELQAQQHSLVSEAITGIAHAKNYDATKLQELYKGAAPDTTLQGLNDFAEAIKPTLSSRIYLAPGADQRIKDAHKAAEAAGYYPAYGTGIGHILESPLVEGRSYGDVEKALGVRQKIAGALGLSGNRFTDMTISQQRALGTRVGLTNALSDGFVKPFSPSVNAKSIMNVVEKALHDEENQVQNEGTLTRTAVALATPLRKRAAELELRAKKTVPTPEAVNARLKEMNDRMNDYVGIRDTSRKSFIRILTDPERVPSADAALRGLSTENGIMSEADASKVYDIMVRGYSFPGAYMTGGQNLEDTFRSGMGILGNKFFYDNKGVAGALSSATVGLARVPNNAYRLMTKIRYQLSPYFDLRRLFKTNIKLGVNGVPPVLEPVRALMQMGEGAYQHAHDLLDKVFPEQANPWLDANDRILSQQSIFGLYNPRHFMAYTAQYLHNQGADLPQIRKTLDKVYTYGDRTAAERTVNTVFFPFSFDKTLYKNVGGYLLDHPAQAMVMLRGFQHYDEWSQNNTSSPAAYTWWQSHAPIFNEFSRLNAFTHGVGLGELGGINAPLLQNFLPIGIPSTQASHNSLKAYLPQLADFSRIYTEGQQTWNAAHTGLSEAKQRAEVSLGMTPQTYAGINQMPSTEQGTYAISDALKLSRNLRDAFKPELQFNRTHTSATGYTWPKDDTVPADVRGQKISSTTISKVVADRFPQFNPTKAIDSATARASDLSTFLALHQDDASYAGLSQFSKDVSSLQRKYADGTVNDDDAATYSDSLRSYAQAQIKAEPGWQNVYDQFFATVLGPLNKKVGSS